MRSTMRRSTTSSICAAESVGGTGSSRKTPWRAAPREAERVQRREPDEPARARALERQKNPPRGIRETVDRPHYIDAPALGRRVGVGEEADRSAGGVRLSRRRRDPRRRLLELPLHTASMSAHLISSGSSQASSSTVSNRQHGIERRRDAAFQECGELAHPPLHQLDAAVEQVDRGADRRGRSARSSPW